MFAIILLAGARMTGISSPLKDKGMTTETNRAQARGPRGISRIDPALREAAAGLSIVEYRAESLPAERQRADRLAAERVAAVDTGNVSIEDRAIAGPGHRRLACGCIAA